MFVVKSLDLSCIAVAKGEAVVQSSKLIHNPSCSVRWVGSAPGLRQAFWYVHLLQMLTPLLTVDWIHFLFFERTLCWTFLFFVLLLVKQRSC